MDTDVKNNGHSDQPIPEDIKAFLDFDNIRNTFTTQNVTSAIEKLVDPGKDTKDLIMRAHFWDFDYKTAWTCLLALAKHFDDKELEELLMNVAAGDAAVGGYRIELLVQSVIGRLDPQRKMGFGDKLRNWAGMGKDKDGNQ